MVLDIQKKNQWVFKVMAKVDTLQTPDMVSYDLCNAA